MKGDPGFTHLHSARHRHPSFPLTSTPCEELGCKQLILLALETEPLIPLMHAVPSVSPLTISHNVLDWQDCIQAFSENHRLISVHQAQVSVAV